MESRKCNEMLGDVPYLDYTFTRIFTLDKDIHIRISCIGTETAKINFTTNGNGGPMNLGILYGFELWDMGVNEIVPVFMDECWLIAWTVRYELRRNGKKLLEIVPQRRQSLFLFKDNEDA